MCCLCIVLQLASTRLFLALQELFCTMTLSWSVHWIPIPMTSSHFRHWWCHGCYHINWYEIEYYLLLIVDGIMEWLFSIIWLIEFALNSHIYWFFNPLYTIALNAFYTYQLQRTSPLLLCSSLLILYVTMLDANIFSTVIIFSLERSTESNTTGTPKLP